MQVKVQSILINQQMSDEEVAFDDWQAEAEAVVEEVKNEQPVSAETEQPVLQQVQEAPKEKLEVVDPRQLFLARIAKAAALSDEKFEDYLEEIKAESSNTEVKGSNQILKNDKDFAQFARSVGRRLNEHASDEEQNIDENNLFLFVEELFVQLYGKSEWKNFENVKDKLKIVKRERKDEEVKAKKRKEKEEREKKQQKAEQEEKPSPKKGEGKAEQEEDIFDGATFINSKQLDDERKNKEKVKVEAPPKPAEDDDDDFM